MYDEDDKIISTFCQVLNVTQRKKAMLKVKERKNHLNILLETMTEGVITINPNGEFSFANQSAEKILRHKKNELIGMKYYDFMPEIFLPDNRKIRPEEITALLNDRGFIKDFVIGFRKSDHSFIWININASPVLDENNEIIQYVCTFSDTTIRKRIEEEIKDNLQEKEILINEIHHRVKNNMQTISSLINLQILKSDNSELIPLLQDASNRVLSMANIHEMLYETKDFSRINFNLYVRKLIINLLDTYIVDKSKISYTINIDAINLDLNTAIPLGLLINELTTNSVRHAFPGDKKGKISIELVKGKKDDQFELSFGDNGIGIPENININKSMGLNLIVGFVKQLHGKMDIKREQGTQIKVIFKKLKQK